MANKASIASALRALPIAAAPVVALALAGCGGSSSGATTKVVPPAAIPVKSAAVRGTSLLSRYTCDGKDASPPLEWGAVPVETRELVLFVVGIKPTGTPGDDTDSMEWAVAGIDPELHRLAPGRLPAGAHAGLNTDSKQGYSVCPAKGQTEQYQFILYALRPGVKIAQHFGGLPTAVELSQPGTRFAPTAEGGFTASYKRR